MHTSKWSFVSIVALSLIYGGCCDWTKYKNRQRAVRRSADTPYWEYMLREFVFKTISPPPPGNNALYKRLQDAPFYGGPFPIISKDASVVLSRGDVYYLPSGYWMFCQEGCVDCDVCSEQTISTVKWILRRIKRLSSHGSPRHDLQLTVIPQIDGSYHEKNLWPRSYVYVTSQGEQAAYSLEQSGYHRAGSGFSDLDSDLRRSANFWKLVDRDSTADRRDVENSTGGPNTLKKNEVTGRPELSGTPEYRYKWRNVRKQRPRLRPSGRSSTEDTLTGTSTEGGAGRAIPRLILGTDQRGQKHLVHLVPAEPGTTASSNPYSSGSVPVSSSDQGTRSPMIVQDRNAYQRMLRRIFDSLNSHRISIESFLEPSTNVASQLIEEHQQQETRNGLAGSVDRYSRTFVVPINWSRQRRKTGSGININSLQSDTNISQSSTISYSVDSGLRDRLDGSILPLDIRKRDISGPVNFKPTWNNYRGQDELRDTKKASAIPVNLEVERSPSKFKVVANTEPTTVSSEDIHDRNKMLILGKFNTKSSIKN